MSSLLSGQMRFVIHFFWAGSLPLAGASNRYGLVMTYLWPGYVLVMTCYLLQTLRVTVPGHSDDQLLACTHWGPCGKSPHRPTLDIPPQHLLLCQLCSLPQGSSSFSNDWSREFCKVLLRIHMHAALGGDQFRSVQSLSCVWLFAVPWTAAHQASLSITNSQSLPKPMSIELVIPSNHLILCCPPLLLPSIYPSIRVFSNESVLHIRWPKYWSFSFSISPSN